MFIREKRISVNNYMEVDIFPMTTQAEIATRGKRQKKKKVSRPAQNNLNEKNARRYFKLLGKGNFGLDDYYMTLTLSNMHLPKTPEEAKKMLKNFLRKVSLRYKKANKVFKYIYVMEFQEEDEIKRLHFHLLISKGIDRDELEDCWSKGRGKNKQSIGRVTTRRIKPDSDGIQALVNYLTKQPRWKKGVKSWSSSQNLTKPEQTKSDFKYSRRQIEKYCLSNDFGYEELQKKYQKYHITAITPKYNDLKGWHLYLEMVKKEE